MAEAKNNDASQGMDYLQSMPRRWVTVYIPIVLFVIVLLFPFYWMAITSFKPNEELYSYQDHNPLWIASPTLDNVRKLLFETPYPWWLLRTMVIAAAAVSAVFICRSRLAATRGAAARSS